MVVTASGSRNGKTPDAVFELLHGRMFLLALAQGSLGGNDDHALEAFMQMPAKHHIKLILSEAKLTATEMSTSAKVSLEQVDGGFSITAVHLTLKAKIPGTDQKTFEELANKAKAGCPVSKVLKADITMDATLEA